ncbi:AI-2E family transporter [Conexibacter sp. CPCC 206217]|uniref:AI-2E family transporter n=1 Tax=Conexibacter sp. CPCC 206217 TaxID=3064574 RepID=UPI002721005E|nr:AI-2E family transporter [Conexibacter sp. CPCC 206217]MDO8214208.1 AI-2E family transporter [Conexibacter sp. CPCC 206217]
MIRGRLHRRRGGASAVPDETIEIDPGQLGRVLAAPPWLRNAGLMSWLAAGVLVLLLGLVWLASLAHAIVMPLIAATVVAAVGAPVVRWLADRGIPRAVGTGLLLLGIIAFGALIVLLIVGGVTGEAASVESHLADAETTVTDWLKSLGIDSGSASSATQQAGDSGSSALRALTSGVARGIEGLSSLVFFLALTVLSLFFLLKDGPSIRHWVEHHAGVPVPIARLTLRRVLQSLRGYFFGVTLVAAYSAAIVGVGSLVIGVPMAGTIAVVTFLGGFVPYLGAWSAGAFAVLLALSGGADMALAMIVLQLLANGIFQQLVQPFAYGAALGIHPLAVLVVTIGGGALFGGVGLVLAAPVTSALVRISADVARARAAAEAAASAAADDASGADPEPAPS